MAIRDRSGDSPAKWHLRVVARDIRNIVGDSKRYNRASSHANTPGCVSPARQTSIAGGTYTFISYLRQLLHHRPTRHRRIARRPRQRHVAVPHVLPRNMSIWWRVWILRLCIDLNLTEQTLCVVTHVKAILYPTE